MDKKEFLNNILKIHSVSVATIDKEGKPSSRIIDMMYIEDDCLYFLTARGKNFYEEIKNNNYISFSCQRYNKAYMIKGYVEQVEQSKYLDILFNHNRYMWGTYPKDTRKVLEVFKIYKWSGEYFDLTSKPITRISFKHNWEEENKGCFEVTDKCINCEKCLLVCPQKCIKFKDNKANIIKENCLRCGACKEICPAKAIIKV